MKTFRRILAVAVLVYLPVVAKADAPPGFADVMDQVMQGDIVLQETVNTSTEFEDVFRAYFNKVTPDAYAALIVDYPKYPDMFDEIKEAHQISVNADRTVFTYGLKMVVAVGPFHQTITPEGRHTLTINASGESHVLNEITNYQNYLNYATESTRLIPYQNGMLVEDTVHASLKSSNAAAGFVKKQLQNMFKGYLAAFRDHLQGNY